MPIHPKPYGTSDFVYQGRICLCGVRPKTQSNGDFLKGVKRSACDGLDSKRFFLVAVLSSLYAIVRKSRFICLSDRSVLIGVILILFLRTLAALTDYSYGFDYPF